MAQAIPIAALAIAAAGTSYQIVSTEEAQSRAKKTAAEQSAAQNALLNEQKAQAGAAEKAAADEQAKLAGAQDRNSALARQKALAAGAGGRSSTILTSPLGVTGQPAQAGKTLLGA